jgi:hypothetical protein
MIIHEYGHMLGAYLQGVNSRIVSWKFCGLPSLKTYPDSAILNNTLFYISGGLFAGLILLIMFVCTIPSGFNSILFPLSTLGVMHIIYSIYETYYIEKLSTKIYMIGHYILYGIVILSCILLWYGLNIWH